MQQVTEMYFAVVGAMCPIGCSIRTREEQLYCQYSSATAQLIFAQSLTRTCPCATCIWLLHPAPASAQEGLDPQ